MVKNKHTDIENQWAQLIVDTEFDKKRVTARTVRNHPKVDEWIEEYNTKFGKYVSPTDLFIWFKELKGDDPRPYRSKNGGKNNFKSQLYKMIEVACGAEYLFTAPPVTVKGFKTREELVNYITRNGITDVKSILVRKPINIDFKVKIEGI